MTTQALASARYGSTTQASIEQRLDPGQVAPALAAGDAERRRRWRGRKRLARGRAALAHAWHAIGDPDNASTAHSLPALRRRRAEARPGPAAAGCGPARQAAPVAIRRGTAGARVRFGSRASGYDFVRPGARLRSIRCSAPTRNWPAPTGTSSTPVSRHQPPPPVTARAGLLMLEPLADELEVLGTFRRC